MKIIERIHVEFPELSELQAQCLSELVARAAKVKPNAHGEREMPIDKKMDKRGIAGLQKRGLLSVDSPRGTCYVPSHVIGRML